MPETVPPTPDTPTETTPPAPPSSDSPKRSLEDSLSGLDDSTRSFVLSQVQKARTEAQNLRDRLKTAEPKLAEYDQLKQASLSEVERAQQESTRWQSEAQTWRTQALSHRIEALAAAVEFADPSDAVAALAEKTGGYLDAGGQIDEQQIRADLADVLERKPHWRKQASTDPAVPRVPAPNPSQGSSGGRPVAGPAQEFASFLRAQMGT